MPEDDPEFPSQEEMERSKQIAQQELFGLVRDRKLDITGIPLTFENVSNIVAGAPDPELFLRQLVKLACTQSVDPKAGAEKMAPSHRAYLEKFPTLFHRSTGRMFEIDRAIILFGFRDAADGATLVRPRLEDILDSPRAWSDAEQRTVARLRRFTETGDPNELGPEKER